MGVGLRSMFSDEPERRAIRQRKQKKKNGQFMFLSVHFILKALYSGNISRRFFGGRDLVGLMRNMM